ncbi:hypothetical protein JW992_03315 [candidate division KSB1 bacterium]|nr:hypothetical protein [candidate division KSB1 bacterium]
MSASHGIDVEPEAQTVRNSVTCLERPVWAFAHHRISERENQKKERRSFLLEDLTICQSDN